MQRDIQVVGIDVEAAKEQYTRDVKQQVCGTACGDHPRCHLQYSVALSSSTAEGSSAGSQQPA